MNKEYKTCKNFITSLYLIYLMYLIIKYSKINKIELGLIKLN